LFSLAKITIFSSINTIFTRIKKDILEFFGEISTK